MSKMDFALELIYDTDAGHFPKLKTDLILIHKTLFNFKIYKIMLQVQLKKRPARNLITSDFFTSDPIFENRLLNTNFFNEDFWNGKSQEPALNIKETEDAFEVELAAPGFSKKDFEVTIEDGCLNISAEKSESKEEADENYTRKEFSYNSFEKRLQLPDSIKDENVKARYKDGILSFNLIKKEEARAKKPKVIEIT